MTDRENTDHDHIDVGDGELPADADLAPAEDDESSDTELHAVPADGPGPLA